MAFLLIVLGFWLEELLLKVFPSCAHREGLIDLIAIL
jgi:hypothetical protein